MPWEEFDSRPLHNSAQFHCILHPAEILLEVTEDVLTQVTDDQRYMFKAPFKLRDKKSLLKLLKRRDLNGEGGVFYDDVNESLPKAEKIVQSLTGDGKIIQVRIWLGILLKLMMIYRFWSVFLTLLMRQVLLINESVWQTLFAQKSFSIHDQ